MQTYNAIAGQSIYDVCLQTYGSLNYLFKLMQDNNIQGLDELVSSRQPFVWDDTLVVDQLVNAAFAATNTRYSTDMAGLGNVYWVVNQEPINSVPNSSPTPFTPQTPQTGYSVTLATTWTSPADSVTVITPLDINGNTLVGCDVIQVEMEIKPLVPEGQPGAQWVWNKLTGVLTLINNTYADQGVLVSILYTKLV